MNSLAQFSSVIFSVISGIIHCFVSTRFPQELRPKGMDVRQDELGDLVDKEMAATSAAIEEAVRRIDVSIIHHLF